MSVRAYRVEKIKRANYSTFNLWHEEDEALRDLIESEDGFFNYLNMDGCGMADVKVTTLEKALATLKLSDYVIDMIKGDIKWAKKHGEEYITYECF